MPNQATVSLHQVHISGQTLCGQKKTREQILGLPSWIKSWGRQEEKKMKNGTAGVPTTRPLQKLIQILITKVEAKATVYSNTVPSCFYLKGQTANLIHSFRALEPLSRHGLSEPYGETNLDDAWFSTSAMVVSTKTQM